MSRPLKLRKSHLLPDETQKIARLIRDNQPIELDRLKSLVHKSNLVDEDDVPKSIRMLKMSENLKIEDNKMSIRTRWCGEDTGIHVMEKFRRWKKQAQNS